MSDKTTTNHYVGSITRILDRIPHKHFSESYMIVMDREAGKQSVIRSQAQAVYSIFYGALATIRRAREMSIADHITVDYLPVSYFALNSAEFAEKVAMNAIEAIQTLERETREADEA